MADTVQETNQEQQTKQETQTVTKDTLIPKEQFEEIHSKYEEAQKQLQQLLTEKENADKKAKEEQGKFEELYKTTATELNKAKEGYTTTNNRVQQLEQAIQGLIDTKLQGIPEDYHDLIPTNLTPEARLNWLTNAENKGLFKTQKDEPLGQPTNPGKTETTDLNSLSPMQLIRMGYAQK
ncbi:hypothetical protein [Heliorestis convoluta]|uniref:Phage scaffold protein n=1 Tax=Heliorestis convoluta TaxID=356322 RepID=A0A5Q2MYD2_9FIRM|nr:hypothetical protein [Heliorestis convoluta]QGG47647.1 hypothetical protein FTV88_1547 [Heliorestis convoluta]